MKFKMIRRALSAFLLLGATAAVLPAQQLEITPYAGGFWPSHTDFNGVHAEMRNEGTYGLREGLFLTHNIEVEGNVGYISHFESRLYPGPEDASMGIPARTVFAVLYDVNGSWNFGHNRLLGSRVSPYVTVGVGGLTAEVRHASSTILAGQYFTTVQGNGSVIVPSFTPVIRINDGATFLTMNFGAGIKAMNLWGPVGLRADVRARTMPNFFGRGLYWPEATGGLTFTFGE